MSAWTPASQRVSEFVSRFLDRGLGATNDPRQRVPVYDPLPNKFYVGKLLPESDLVAKSEYKAKVAPCSYIATFLIAGKPPSIRLRITPSFNLYFLTAIRKAAGASRDADPSVLDLYSAQADPALPADSGRDDMWANWRDRQRPVPAEFTATLRALEAPKEARGRLRGKYDAGKAIDAYIRKRYCTSVDVELPSVGTAAQLLDLDGFRTTYLALGRAPQWKGRVNVYASPEGDNTRVTVYLTNTFPLEQTPSGDPNWYDTHLRVELLGDLAVVPVPCPVLAQVAGHAPEIIAEAKNCAFDASGSTAAVLTFSPIARTQTTRRAAREVDFSFAASAEDPPQLLEVFYRQLAAASAQPDTLAAYRRDIDRLLADARALAAVGMAARVYAKTIGTEGRWRFHQLATLIHSAAAYLAREGDPPTPPRPLVLNVPTAGGKTEAFFAAAMFCAFYELQRSRRSVNIIKYPMTLLSNDQVARLARYSMVVDEIAGKPLGIGYLVGGKGQWKSPAEVIERCPYPDAAKPDGMCGELWQPFAAKGGVPTLRCPAGHILHLSIDDEGQMLTRHCPAFLVSIWDKFVSQSAQRRLALLFGAPRYLCPQHGFVDFADTNQYHVQGKPLPGSIQCQVYEAGQPCGAAAVPASSIVPGVLVFDEGHLIRESEGTLDSHFETAYLQIAQDLSGRQPLPIVSTATIAGIDDFLEQLGLIAPASKAYDLLPPPAEQGTFYQAVPGEMQHEAIALVPFDVMLTWAMPDLIDVFFETLATDYGYDAADVAAAPPAGLEHLRQIMAYCSSYKNISALMEMNQNAVAANRMHRQRARLNTLQLSARYFSRVRARQAIDAVKNMRQQIIYATNIASIGIDIENLDVIFFFGLPSNVSEFIQAMNRTGRRPGRPAICVAVLGPNKERDMSYYRYWPQFVNGANRIVEPVPLNRFASSAITRTFNNVATALILMDYAQRSQRKIWNTGEVRGALAQGVLPEGEMLARLKQVYRAAADPAQEYEQFVEALWSRYEAAIRQVPAGTFISQAFNTAWMLSLRASERPTPVLYPEAADVIERSAGGVAITGDVDSNEAADVASASLGE